jgi:hypothetical protein
MLWLGKVLLDHQTLSKLPVWRRSNSMRGPSPGSGGARLRRPDDDAGSFVTGFKEQSTNTTLLVSSMTERLNLVGLNKPQHEILEEPEQYLPMHVRQRATCD